MILSSELLRHLADRTAPLVISPILDASVQIGSASIDLRLGPDIIVSKRATGATAFDASDPVAFRRALEARQQYVRRRLGDTFHLQPGEFVLARTLEYVRLPPDISGQALGRSSWGRLGLTIATATMIQPGFAGTITLELGNSANTPIILKIGLSIAQLMLDRAPGGQVVDETGESAGAPEEDGEAAEKRAENAAAWLSRNSRKRGSGRYTGQVKPALSRLDRDYDVPWVVPMAVRYAVGVIGERFSGKSTAVAHLVGRRGFELYRISDVLRREAARRGLNPDKRENLQVLGDGLRDEHGADILARILFARIRADHLDPERHRQPAKIVIEGFKVAEELELWQRLSLFVPLVIAGTQTRVETRNWRRDRALAGGWLEDPRYGPCPTELPEQDAWFAKVIDEPAQRHQLGPVVSAAMTSPAVMTVANAQPGIPALHRAIDGLLPDLERSWRDREV